MTCLCPVCPDRMTRTRTYMVLMTEALVAQDIALTIADFDPAAQVIRTASMAAAEAALSGVACVEIAFVAGNPGLFTGSALQQALLARGARIVLLGIEAEVTGPTTGFDVLAQPFDTDAVLAKLRPGDGTWR